MHPVVLLLLLGAAAALSTDDDDYAVPPGLLIGAGLSAMQAEGNIDMEAWWGASPEGMNLTVSADHYHRYKEDLQLAKKMKLSIHRFSIAWERIFPEGDASKPSDEGVNFYHDYIQEVRKNDMEPVVTIFFFSFPIAVAQRINGGWTNQSMIDEYLQFADFLFKTYGDKVKYWVSVNEPNMYCPYFTPSSDIEVMYRCNHNLILAHMKAHKLYKKKYGQYGGQVGYSLLLSLAQPASTHYLDVIAADGWNTVYAGAAFHALTYGDYPAQFRYLADEGARRDGYKGSRLPYFTEEEKRDLVGSSDFFGVNIYETLGAAYKDPSTPAEASRLWKKMVRDLPFLNLTDSQDLMSPYPMEFSLLWAWNNFHVPLLITENGYGDMTGMGIHDHDRAVYHSLNIRTLVRTMKNHGVKVIGYCAWSLIDVFEWSGDYRQPFGLIHVDQFETGSLNRTLKESSKLFIEIGETGRVPKVEPTSGAAMHSLSSALLVLLLGCALQ